MRAAWSATVTSRVFSRRWRMDTLSVHTDIDIYTIRFHLYEAHIGNSDSLSV